MEIIDELVPLTADDIKQLEADRYSSTAGCSIPFFIIFAVSGFFAFQYFGVSYLWLFLLIIVSLLFLIVGLWLFFSGPTENKDVALDIKEGNKRRIVAPIEKKEIVEVKPRRSSSSVNSQMGRSVAELKFNYFMQVKDWKFDLTEEQYLSGAKKGDFVEFYVAPHSGKILSPPIEVRE